MPWDFEDISDDWLPGEKGLIDRKYEEEWPKHIWPWWRRLFADTSSDLSGVLRNVRAGRTPAETESRRQEVRPIIEAALLMMMLDTVTRRRTGPDAQAVEAFHRDNLLNLRQGDLAAFIDRLGNRGVQVTAIPGFKQGDLRPKYGVLDHDHLHEDVIRYLFQVDLIEAEIEGIWLAPAIQFFESGSADFRSAAVEAARQYLLYCFASPLRRLRVAIRATSPRVPLVRQCAKLLQTSEWTHWLGVLDALCAQFGMRPRVATNVLIAGWTLDYLNGAVAGMEVAPDPAADTEVDAAVSGFELLILTLYGPMSDDEGDESDGSEDVGVGTPTHEVKPE